MRADEVRFLYAYDRWATSRVLGALDGAGAAWDDPSRSIAGRTLGTTFVHQLGAAQRWRHGFQQSGQSPMPELEPLPTISEMRDRWEEEWRTVDAWLPTLTDEFVNFVFEGTPVWQMIVHVINHGTQHRAEAAGILTALGRSPGELDLINYVEEQQEEAAPS
jgi:uncharacterized damage-inducible protein DinB